MKIFVVLIKKRKPHMKFQAWCKITREIPYPNQSKTLLLSFLGFFPWFSLSLRNRCPWSLGSVKENSVLFLFFFFFFVLSNSLFFISFLPFPPLSTKGASLSKEVIPLESSFSQIDHKKKAQFKLNLSKISSNLLVLALSSRVGRFFIYFFTPFFTYVN